MTTTIEEYENNELTDCWICNKQESVKYFKDKGKYQGLYGYDEPFPHSYKTFCEDCNKEYQGLKQKARDTNYKFEKQLLAKIRKAIKRNCKTLSILKGKTYVWDIEISPLIKDHNYRCFNEEEMKTLVEWKIFDNTKGQTNSAWITDMYYFYLKFKDKIEGKKRAIAKGKISPVDNITIQKNELKQGIEIVFPNKPERAVLTKLKELGFRWNNRNKLWYIKESNLTIEGENFIKSLT